MTLAEKRTKIFPGIIEPLICFWGATTEQVYEICEAYTNLWASTSGEHQAKEIYDSLVAIALTDDKSYPLHWLSTELQFEAFVVATGDRKWAALMELEYGTHHVNDSALDLYNERINREVNL